MNSDLIVEKILYHVLCSFNYKSTFENISNKFNNLFESHLDVQYPMQVRGLSEKFMDTLLKADLKH